MKYFGGGAEKNKYELF